MSESKALCLCAVVLCRTYKKSLVRRSLGALKLAGNVDDPLTWCGAARTTLCGGRGDPHPLWRISLVEIGIKVTVIVSTEET